MREIPSEMVRDVQVAHRAVAYPALLKAWGDDAADEIRRCVEKGYLYWLVGYNALGIARVVVDPEQK